MMNNTRTLRYTLFGLLFALVVLGLILHSYALLIGLVIAGIVLGIVGDRIENAPTEPFKQLNELHHRKEHAGGHND
jgi:hypothetical protein